MDITKLDRYAQLEIEEIDLKEKLKVVASQMDSLERAIVDQMGEEGLKRVGLENGRTYGLKRYLSASPHEEVTREQVGEALIASGLGGFIKSAYHAGTLQAWVKEQAAEVSELKAKELNIKGYVADPSEVDAYLPEPLRGLLNIRDGFKLSSLKTV